MTPSLPSADLAVHPSDEAVPALSRIETWIFDLDNTLYPASSSLFPQIDIRMRLFIAERLGLDLDAAFRLQKRYYRDYGTTLRGLMLKHGVDPDEFLSFVHDIDHSVLKPAPRLAAALAALPGRRLVYTNGSCRHAEQVMARLGIGACFEAIFDIKAGNYVPKPDRQSYAAMMARHGVDPKRAAMFEDIARNLAPAAALGMTTILVEDPDPVHWSAEATQDTSFVDHVTHDLAGWLESVGALS